MENATRREFVLDTDLLKKEIPDWYPNTDTQFENFLEWVFFIHGRAAKISLANAMGRANWPFVPGFIENQKEKTHLQACFDLAMALIESLGLSGKMAKVLTQGIYELLTADPEGDEWRVLVRELVHQWEERS